MRFWMNISIGLVAASAADAIRLEDLIQQADRALLLAKKGGRNRIIISGEA